MTKRVERRFKEMVTEVYTKEIGTITKKLGLKKTPVIEFVDDLPVPMSVFHTFHYRHEALFTKIIVEVTTDSVIHVNPKLMGEVLLEVGLICCSKRAMYDAILLYLSHECRHIWQDESGWWVGREYVSSEVKYSYELTRGHGQTPEEVEANKWVLSQCKGKKKRLMKFIAEEQNNTVKTLDTKDNVMVTGVAAAKAYNPLWAYTLRGICLTAWVVKATMIGLTKVLHR